MIDNPITAALQRSNAEGICSIPRISIIEIYQKSLVGTRPDFFVRHRHYTTALVDQLISAHEPVNATAWAGYFLQKMRKAQILYDRTGRLTAIQQAVQSAAKGTAPFIPISDSEKLGECFWLNHTLLHLQRMVQSTDPIYTRAVELMLMGGLATICCSYYRLRDLPWEGEKAALRYLQQADPAYLALLDQALAITDRQAKVDAYAQLVAATLEGVGELWQPGGTAVILHNADKQQDRGHEAVAFWEELLRSAA